MTTGKETLAPTGAALAGTLADRLFEPDAAALNQLPQSNVVPIPDSISARAREDVKATEIQTAATFARLSGLCYLPQAELADALAEEGLRLVASGHTHFTRCASPAAACRVLAQTAVEHTVIYGKHQNQQSAEPDWPVLTGGTLLMASRVMAAHKAPQGNRHLDLRLQSSASLPCEEWHGEQKRLRSCACGQTWQRPGPPHSRAAPPAQQELSLCHQVHCTMCCRNMCRLSA